ncbi:hypothetical protein RMA73_00205 (plasmid) [Xanthomonas translucens pv. translucens]|uniref:hypothetical protein n=1 Tax=Xanthomonas campestris pv. translucens TaxID=343 RepID=UPI00288A307E|nr:hypothetical protein [Xanthomonas translucens]WNJ25332.1 hypothetical protein RMA73_00450 [Xanthomonas translucens pv. translucens]WNJ25378.1 hypothetical protein RMA73_00205 [Xanthomonas translucens pv. translucens]
MASLLASAALGDGEAEVRLAAEAAEAAEAAVLARWLARPPDRRPDLQERWQVQRLDLLPVPSGTKPAKWAGQ